MFGFKFGNNNIRSRKKHEKYRAAKYCIVNTFLKRTNPTWVNNSIHYQKTNVCVCVWGEQSKFNIFKLFYRSGARSVLGCKRVRYWEMSLHYTHRAFTVY